jgi:hypothetical protein
MNNKPIALFLVGATLSGLCTYVLTHDRSASRPVRHASAAPAPGEEEAEPALPPMAPPVVFQPSIAPAAYRPAPIKAAPTTASAPAERYSEKEINSAIETRFDAEQADGSWSREAARDLRDHVAQKLPATSQLLNVECRASMCRVETSHASVDFFRAFVKTGLFSRDMQWDGPKMTWLLRTDPDGSVVTVAYLGRGPAPLYDPEQP